MIELLENLRHLFEGWKDVHTQYVVTKKVPEDVFNQFKESDPSTTNKYLPWMCKQYVVDPGRQRHIIDVAKAFDGLVEKHLLKGDNSDIYQHTLDSADEVVSSKSGEKSKGKVKREQKSESQIIGDTDDYLIVVPESHAASCYYGANTQWCVSGRDSHYWDEYFVDNIVIYIIIDKKHNKKYAVAVSLDNEKECFDEKDKAIDFATIEKQIGVKLPDVFKPLTKKGIIDRIIASCTKNSDGTYSTDDSVNFERMNLTQIPAKFKYVGGYFSCSNNRLTSLQGAPQKVGGYFSCGGNFYCDNNKLTTLEGAPQKVGGYFSCSDNRLTSLQGAPQEVGGYFSCSDNRLTTLEGAPQEVGEDFYCSNNRLTGEELKKTVDRKYFKK